MGGFATSAILGANGKKYIKK